MHAEIRSRARALASASSIAILVGSVLVVALAPASATTPTTGAWIFPNSKRADAVADDLDDTFYIAGGSDDWLRDSFFGDTANGSADVSVDIYNPTSSTLYNVQIFAAVSISGIDLLNSIDFDGGDGGASSFVPGDFAGGTPFLAGGSSMDDHDIYPAYFVSYSVGDLDAGSSNISTITVQVDGDFVGGLVVHLDYSAEDASGNGVEGPFEADMNLFENGDIEEPPACVPGDLEVSQSVSTDEVSPGGSFTWKVSVQASEGELPAEFDLQEVQAWTMTHELLHGLGATHNSSNDSTFATPSVGAWTNASRSVTVSPLLLVNNFVELHASVEWVDACDGTLMSAAASDVPTVTVVGDASGDVHSANWWEEQAEKTAKGKRKAVFTEDEFDQLLQRVALHSDVFTYGEWDGTAPTGDDDDGWVDIDSLAKARKVLEKKTNESRKVRGAEKQDLALWLNIASGGINLDTSLEIYEKKNRCRGQHSEFEDQTGLSSISSAYDTPAEILAFLEDQIADWKDGSGDSRGDLRLARKLAKSVNHEWLVAA